MAARARDWPRVLEVPRVKRGGRCSTLANASVSSGLCSTLANASVRSELCSTVRGLTENMRPLLDWASLHFPSPFDAQAARGCIGGSKAAEGDSTLGSLVTSSHIRKNKNSSKQQATSTNDTSVAISAQVCCSGGLLQTFGAAAQVPLVLAISIRISINSSIHWQSKSS